MAMIGIILAVADDFEGITSGIAYEWPPRVLTVVRGRGRLGSDRITIVAFQLCKEVNEKSNGLLM
jgi:hypothetical protein